MRHRIYYEHDFSLCYIKLQYMTVLCNSGRAVPLCWGKSCARVK